MRSALPLLLSSIVLACSSAPSQPVPVIGAPGDVMALAGEWDGTYEADDGSRGGSIDFHLQAGKDTATGDVLMVPSDWGRPVEAYDRPSGAVAEGTPPRTLTIRFVRVQGGQVSGRLDPYRDPSCGCRLLTTFRGNLKGNKLSGTYESHHEETGRDVTGKWRAERKPSP
jgi:hypothetical protein